MHHANNNSRTYIFSNCNSGRCYLLYCRCCFYMQLPLRHQCSSLQTSIIVGCNDSNKFHHEQQLFVNVGYNINNLCTLCCGAHKFLHPKLLLLHYHLCCFQNHSNTNFSFLTIMTMNLLVFVSFITMINFCFCWMSQ